MTIVKEDNATAAISAIYVCAAAAFSLPDTRISMARHIAAIPLYQPIISKMNNNTTTLIYLEKIIFRYLLAENPVSQEVIEHNTNKRKRHPSRRKRQTDLPPKAQR